MQGFTPDGGFVIGNTCYWPHLDPQRVSFDARGNRIAGGFSQGGTQGEWSAAAEILLSKGYETYAFCLLASLSAPLQGLFKDTGLAIAVHFPSRSGRDLIAQTITSLWGDRNCLTLRQEEPLDDRLKSYREYNGLPIFYEDLLRLDPYTKSKFVPLILDQSRLLFCCNTEDALEEDKVLTLNHKTRRRVVLELTSQVKGKDLMDEKKLSVLLARNFGHAGPLLYQYVVRNRQAVVDLVRKVEERVYEDIHRGNMDMRPWSALTASVSVAAMVAEKLGLLHITPQRTVDWLLEQIEANHTGKPALLRDAEDILTNFLLEQDTHVALLSGEDEGGRSYMTPYLEPRPSDLVRVRYEYQRNRLILETRYFKEWLGDKGHKYLATRNALIDKLIIVRENYNYDLQCRMRGRAKFRQNCLILDARTPCCQTAIQAWAKRHDVPLIPHQNFPRFQSFPQRFQEKRERLAALSVPPPVSPSPQPAASPGSSGTSVPSAPPEV